MGGGLVHPKCVLSRCLVRRKEVDRAGGKSEPEDCLGGFVENGADRQEGCECR